MALAVVVVDCRAGAALRTGEVGAAEEVDAGSLLERSSMRRTLFRMRFRNPMLFPRSRFFMVLENLPDEFPSGSTSGSLLQGGGVLEDVHPCMNSVRDVAEGS